MAALYDLATTGDIVTNTLRRFPDRVAFKQDGRELTYRQVEDTLQRWIAVLVERGFRSGEGVGLLSLNCPEAWFAQVAPAIAGGRYTALHPLGSFDDHLHVCNEAELRYIFVDQLFIARAAELKEKASSVRAIFTFGPADVGEDIHQLAAKVTVAGRLERGPHGPEDMAYLLYTGGTTGVPKAAMLPERAIASLAHGTALGWDFPEEMRYLAVAPISHAAGMPIIPTLIRGGTVVLQRRFDPAAWLQGVANERATVSLVVPTMIYALLDHPALSSTDLSSLQTVIYGASPIAPTRLAEAIERVGPVWCQLYGQTESAGQGTSLWRHQHDAGDTHRLSSCGTPMPFTRASVLDEENNPVPDGTPGEICLQGASIMQGYFRQPDLTAAALAGGWLHTGDIGIRDEDGFYYIVDRKKDMIVSGGFNVFPREIEDVLAQHPAVSNAAVIGVPDDHWGEAVKAIVVLRPGVTTGTDAQTPERLAAELTALVRAKKGPVYAPKSVDFVDSLPMTPVGKADKKVLRAKHWAGRERMV